MASSISTEAMPPTGLVDLPDDVLGRIYEALPKAKGRRAFRHSHPAMFRSHAINSRMQTLNMRIQKDVATGSPVEVMAMLTAFPGQLQTLIVRAGLNLCTIFNVHDTEAIAPLLERCSTVRHLELEGCVLEEADAAASLTLLFPCLGRPQAEAKLVLFDCKISNAFLSALAPRVQLRELVISHCNMSSDDMPDFGLLAGISTLRHLTLDALCCAPDGDMHEVSVADLQQLDSLSIARCHPAGLGALLDRSTSLRRLSLGGDAPLEAQYASSSLHVLDIESVNRSHCILQASRFPALQALSFSVIDLQSGLPFVPANEELVRLAQSVVSWLQTFPSVAAKHLQLLGFEHHLDDDDPGPEFYAALLHELMPLKPILSQACSLTLDWPHPSMCMDALGDLFGSGLSSLSVRSAYAQCNNEHGLLTACQKMPKLRRLELAHLMEPPVDLVATLLVALQCERPLRVLVVWDGSERDDTGAAAFFGARRAISKRSGVVREQWNSLKEHWVGPLTADLVQRSARQES